MDLPILDLLRRAVTALESIAKSLEPTTTQPTTPPTDESQRARHIILSTKVRNQLHELGYDQEDYLQAKKLLASTFEGKTALKQLTFAQLTEFAQTLNKLTEMQNANPTD
jgi:hypothetical protein